MPVIIISSPSFGPAVEVAERTAELVGHRVAGPDVLADAAREHQVPERRLRDAVGGPATWRPMSERERRTCLALIDATLSDRLLDGSCVCHGLAAHLYVTGISHVVRVRVSCSLASRVSRASLQDRLSEASARKLIRRLDAQRRRWVRNLFDLDESDPASFDIVVDAERAGVDGAARLIVDFANQRKFQPMTYSLKQARDHAVAAKVRAALVELDPSAAVRADDGNVRIETKVVGSEIEKLSALRARALAVPGSINVEVVAVDDFFARAAASMR